MIQKTYEIASAREASEVVHQLQKIPEAVSAKEGLLQVFIFGFSYEEMTVMIHPIREAFPELVVTGMTVFMAEPPESDVESFIFDERPVLRLGFFFFETSHVRLLRYELPDSGVHDIVEQIRSEMKTEQQLKGVCVTVAGLSVHISSMLERLTYGFEEIPFFGTMADVYYISERALEPFIFDDERSYLRGVIILLYSGEELHIDAEYIFGWKPIGKSMSIIPSEHEVTIGDTAVSMIDDMTPETVYNKYLGIGFDNYLTINSCQFPLVIERDGLLIGRTPASISEDGEVLFIGSIRPEEKVRFSYTVRNDLLYNTEKRSLDLYDFAPQAVELFICGNRSIMLRKDSNLELECFRRFAPDTLHCSAAGEIYYHHGRGEFLNSALVAVGMREGDKQELAAGDISGELIPERQEGIIPLSERILNFLQAMSGDLMDYARDAQRASKAKSAFLAGMSHEIRTPINAVLGMNEMILREADDQEILSYASDIDQAGHTLLSLINDILDVSKIEEGRMEILPTEYELSSVIGDLVNMIRERAEKKHLELKVDVDGSIPHLLYGDEIRIKQIILNLLTNAVKYTEEGEVRFSIAHEQTAEKEILLKVTVADTGIGMKEEDLDRLFSPFARIDEKRNRSIEGTGLGMSIVKQLLALMDSRLEVQSVYGKGSEFSFVIRQRVVKWEPIGDFSARYAVANKKREEYHELFRAPAARILVVDDTEVNLTVMKNLLKRTEIRIDTALSGKEALQMIRDHTYDVVFIDHMMPDMDGIETLEHIRNITDSIPVCIALTANAVSGAREMYLEAGFADYLSKPIDGKRLELMLKRYLPKDKLAETDQTAGKEKSSMQLPRSIGKDESHTQSDRIYKILVVDDDEIICVTAQEILEKHYHVHSCMEGKEAPGLAGMLKPDLILLDINMAGMDGFEVFQRLQAEEATRHIPVMYITADEDRGKEALALKNGAQDLIRKPFVPEVLLQRCKRIIALDRYQKNLQGEVVRQTDRAERLNKEMMLALSHAVDAKDHYTNGHSERVAAYSAEIARRMGKSLEEQEMLYEIGLLHDIGKIGVPEEIINKTEQLTDKEFGRIKEHTVIGYDILKDIADMPILRDGARHHHEKYDGSGYPDGLSGNRIPEEARIVCVADCYDAMTSTRTYSKPKPQADVRAEFVRCRGSHFDPEIADIMIAMIDDDTDYIMNERSGGRSVWKGRSRLWDDDTDIDHVGNGNIAFTETAGNDRALFGKNEPVSDAEMDMPSWISEIPELHTELGIRNCGSIESYLSVLRTFHQTADSKADEIEKLYNERDLVNYTIKVHALKSSARIIGADALSDLAKELEAAGKSGKEDIIHDNTGILLRMYRDLNARLSLLDGEKKDRKLLTEELRKDALQTMSEIVDSMDFGLMEGILQDLHNYRLSPEDEGLIQRIEELLMELNWEGINREIDAVLNRI